MKVLSYIAGLRCVRCGTLLPFFATAATFTGKRRPAQGRSVDCPSCGNAMRVEPVEKGRWWRYFLAKLPDVLFSLVAVFLVLWLYEEPRKPPQLVSVVVLALALSIPLAIVSGQAISLRLRTRVEPGSR